MTKQERLDRYKYAYWAIDSGIQQFMCHALTVGIRDSKWGRWYEYNFPEFGLLSPRIRTPISRTGSWTRTLKENDKNLRLTILAFAIAMCED